MAPQVVNKARSEMTGQLVVLCAVISISCISYGYDSAWWTGALGQISFNVLYGDKAMFSPIIGPYHVLSATQTAVSVAVSYAFQVVGQFIASFVLKAKGRKAGLLMYAIITMIGTVVEITGTIGKGRFWQIVAGKFVVSIALGLGLGTAPLYLAECSPPSLRGALVNTCTVMVTLGTLFAGVANYGVSTMPPLPLSNTGLRILIGVQLAPPALMFTTLFLIPESPRWLCQMGRFEDARKSITKLRSGTDTAEINTELEGIQAAIDLDKANEAQTGWAQLSKGSDLRRTLTVVGVMSIAQANGLAFLGNYAVVYLKAVGIKNVYVILMILYAVICASTIAGFWTQDHLGRRTVLLPTGCILSASLISLGAVTTAYPAPVGGPAYAVVFLIFLFSVSYATGWGNTPYTLTSEIPSDTLRPRTWAVAGSSAALTGMIVGLVNPYLQDKDHGNLGGRVAFIYGAFGVAGVVFVYFFVPELKNKPIYDINWLYVNGVSPRRMKRYIVPQQQVLPVEDEGKGSQIQLEHAAV